MKPYRFHIDLRTPTPEDGFVPSGIEAKPPPRLRSAPATPQLEAAYGRLLRELEAATSENEQIFTRSGYKHRLFRTGDESVGELRLAPDGSLVRRIYERMGGAVQSLDDLFQVGLSGLDSDEARFAAYPGYELRFARYRARKGKLREVQMGQAAFNAERGCIVVSSF